MPYALTYSIEWAIKKQHTPLQNGICQIDYGLWLMTFSFWLMAYGLWLMAYALCLIPYTLCLNILHRIGGLWRMAHGF